MNEPSVTESLVRLLLDVPYESLSDAALHSAKRMILDSTGCAIVGSADSEFEPIVNYASSFGGKGPIPGPRGGHFDVSTAAFLVGAAAHILDFDDVQPIMGGHPSVTLLPVLLSLGYELGSSGPGLLRAIALGAEMEARLGKSMNPAHYSVGWHPTSTIGCLGASVAASILLGLNVEETRTAIGIAASFSSGTKANFGTTVKSIHAGTAGRAGVESALLVRNGATSNTSILDDQFGGYFNLFTPEVDRASLLGSTETLAIAEPGVSFKLLPCCGSIHSSVWAVIQLFEDGEYNPEEIASIRAYVDPKRIAHTSRATVTRGLEGKFSSQYCQAVAALTGKLTLGDFDDEIVREPRRQELMKKVQVLPAKDYELWPNVDDSRTGTRGALVEIEDTNGTIFAKFNLVPRGYAADPASDEVLRAKFVDCAQRDGRSVDQAEALASSIMHLDSNRDVRPLVSAIWRS